MSRSPLAYPLNRGADMDVGGAADLQTDVMRFMAIISLCLVAIFALVQSMPMTPAAEPLVDALPAPVSETRLEPIREPLLKQVVQPAPPSRPEPKSVTLTRPTWQPKSQATAAPAVETQAKPLTTPAAEETEGFTLRFESDAALMRLVAASQVGVYAIDNDRARRMTVSESRISFWDASLPNSFHEMEVSTVPVAVVEALTRSGVATDALRWGVTLPGKLRGQLDGLMQEHHGGSLVIGSNGNIRLEAL